MVAPLEVATRRLFSEQEKEQTEGIKDLWSLSCGEPIYAVAIGQSPTLLARLMDLCRVCSSSPSRSSSSPSLESGHDADNGSASSSAPGPSSSSSTSGQDRVNWKKIVLALHCLWNLSAYEENKPTFVMKGVVECVQSVLESARWAIHEKQRGDALLCCAAIFQNLSESHFRSGARNQLQVRIVQEGAVEALMFLADPTEMRDISVRFKACLALCNLAVHPQNRRELRRCRAFERVKTFLEKENWDEALSRASIWGSFRVLQPFIPLLQLSPEPGLASNSRFPLINSFRSLAGPCSDASVDSEGDGGDPYFRYVQLFALRCVEKFSSIERYHKKIWHDLAMNGGVQPLKDLIRSSRDAEVQACVRNICRNLSIDLTDAGVSIAASTFHEDITKALDRPDMFPDLVISCIAPPPQGLTEAVRQDILCHKAILATRCEVFATMLSWGDRRGSFQSNEESLHKKMRMFDSNSNCAEEEQHGKGKQVIDSRNSAHDGSPNYGGMRRIEVTEFDYGTMRKVLEYIYYDRTQLDWRCAVDVLRAADIYGLERLKQMCEDVIMQGIDAENLCDLLLLADMHAAPQLFRACVNFICDCHSDLAASSTLQGMLGAHPQLKEIIEREVESRAASREAAAAGKGQKDKEKDKERESDAAVPEEPMQVV